ncbi:MAG: hypothetical protein ACKO7P_14345, partial [Bacteroidota bacterium]
MLKSNIGLSSKFTLADIGLSWIIFFSIVYQKLVPIGFGLMLISLVFQRQKITKDRLISFIIKGPAMWFVLYYFLLVIGMFWSNNIGFGLSKIENKLTFLLFPIVFAYSIITIKINHVIYTLFFGVLISLSISNIMSYYYLSELEPNINWNIFEKISNSKTFSWNMHIDLVSGWQYRLLRKAMLQPNLLAKLMPGTDMYKMNQLMDTLSQLRVPQDLDEAMAFVEKMEKPELADPKKKTREFRQWEDV